MDGSFPIDPAGAELSGQSAVDAQFRKDVDDFLRANLTPELQRAGRETTGMTSSREACDEWREILRERGWLAPSWPEAYGGAGWTTAQRLYFENACVAHDAPVMKSSGIRTIGPLIIAAGSDEQKAHYLPAILAGEHEWCQGFSEPQAGSDLAALGLRADRDGDDFVLNGTKIWTSFASYATHMFLLARSDRQSTRGGGLVFLLVRMDAPGITVRPIEFIDGEAETNEVFFDNVRVPIEDRIGEIGDGWIVAKQLMQVARSNNTTTGVLRQAFRLAMRCAKEAGELDADLFRRFAEMEARIDAFEALEARAGIDGKGLDGPAPSSILKLMATELHQDITALGMDAAPYGALAPPKYFSTRAATIYSGTSEVHRNILAKGL